MIKTLKLFRSWLPHPQPVYDDNKANRKSSDTADEGSRELALRCPRERTSDGKSTGRQENGGSAKSQEVQRDAGTTWNGIFNRDDDRQAEDRQQHEPTERPKPPKAACSQCPHCRGTKSQDERNDQYGHHWITLKSCSFRPTYKGRYHASRQR